MNSCGFRGDIAKQLIARVHVRTTATHPVGDIAPVNLEALLVDYAGHLRHHLGQILSG